MFGINYQMDFVTFFLIVLIGIIALFGLVALLYNIRYKDENEFVVKYGMSTREANIENLNTVHWKSETGSNAKIDGEDAVFLFDVLYQNRNNINEKVFSSVGSSGYLRVHVNVNSGVSVENFNGIVCDEGDQIVFLSRKDTRFSVIRDKDADRVRRILGIK